MSTLSTTNIKNASSTTNNIVLASDGTTTITSPSNIIKSGTAVASTSGTAIDFTGIPSWVKRITVMFNGVSTNGTSNPLIQLGTSAGVTTTGYASAASSTTYTTGFGISAGSASNVLSGQALISLVSGNIWTAILIISNTAAGGGTVNASGVITLAATLDRVRITTVNGTDTFDAGSINILYEG